jgi:hypothetical protein
MQKKTIQIISLVFSVLSLIYFITQYYGYDRYIKLHFNDINPYIKNYSNIPKSCDDRVIICFNSPIQQLPKLQPFLISILDQTVRVDDIILVIHSKDTKYIPEKFKPILTINDYHRNYENDSVNIIRSISTEPESNTKIILVDPTMVYPENFIETFVEHSEKNHDKIIYGSPSKNPKYGILIKPSFFNKITQNDENLCTLLDTCTNASNIVINSTNIYKIFK